MKKFVVALVVGAAVAGLSGCGGSATAAGPASASDATKAAGCTTSTEKETEELFVRALFECDGNRLYVFANEESRDNWKKIANGFGLVTLKQGKTWILAED